jgi:hypothetical protein
MVHWNGYFHPIIFIADDDIHIKPSIKYVLSVWCASRISHRTSLILRIKTRHISVLINTPQTLNYFKSHDFNNYQFLAYIYIT